MNIFVTDEHFRQTWFVFKNDQREGLLRLSEEAFGLVFTFDEGGVEYPAVLQEHVGHSVYPWSYYNEPVIRFSTIGIEMAGDVTSHGNSFFRMDSTHDGFFNAEISLPDLNEMVLRIADIELAELITYARYRWCYDMGINYLRAEAAKDIEERIEIARKQLEAEAEVDANDGDLYNEMLKKLKFMPYKEYLRTEHWRHFREEALKHFQYKCNVCSSTPHVSNLHLHHREYTNRGRETFNDVILLCKDCHHKYHD